MIWIWIVGIILALLLLLLMTRIGIKLDVRNDALRLDAKIGWISLKILPAGAKAQDEKVSAEEGEKEPSLQDKKQKIAFADIKEALKTLWPAFGKALERTRKGIRIHPFSASVIVGGADDPAAGAEAYGWLHAGIWTVMPRLEQSWVIPEPSIHVGIDFDAAEWKWEGNLGISARIGTLIRIGLTIAIPALKWFLRWKKKQKSAAAVQSAAEKATAV